MDFALDEEQELLQSQIDRLLPERIERERPGTRQRRNLLPRPLVQMRRDGTDGSSSSQRARRRGPRCGDDRGGPRSLRIWLPRWRAGLLGLRASPRLRRADLEAWQRGAAAPISARALRRHARRRQRHDRIGRRIGPIRHVYTSRAGGQRLSRSWHEGLRLEWSGRRPRARLCDCQGGPRERWRDRLHHRQVGAWPARRTDLRKNGHTDLEDRRTDLRRCLRAYGSGSGRCRRRPGRLLRIDGLGTCAPRGDPCRSHAATSSTMR